MKIELFAYIVICFGIIITSYLVGIGLDQQYKLNYVFTQDDKSTGLTSNYQTDGYKVGNWTKYFKACIDGYLNKTGIFYCDLNNGIRVNSETLERIEN